ncbi:putative succinyl-CoA transferase [Herbiconiux sp. L3-i23]|nr:putative succinyl-CoA transferase [Herbiconiux sp. L3-i23]
MPFSYPWTRASGDELRRNVVVWQWYLRSQVKPNNWTIAFAVELDGHIVGVQDLKVSEFSALRTVSTGSWLGQPFHGRGIGTEMRAAVLLFAFDALGARFAESGAASWNDASLGVSRRLGYRPNGVSHHVDSQGQTFVEQRLRLDESEFVRPTWQLEVEGFERARADLLG